MEKTYTADIDIEKLFLTFPKAQNGGKNEWLRRVSSKPYFYRMNRHCILKTKNKNGQKVQKVISNKNLS